MREEILVICHTEGFSAFSSSSLPDAEKSRGGGGGAEISEGRKLNTRLTTFHPKESTRKELIFHTSI